MIFVFGIMIIGLIALFIIGVASAGVLIEKAKEDTSVDKDLKASLSSIGITSYEKSQIVCDDNECKSNIKSNGNFNTEVKVERYKDIIHEWNETISYEEPDPVTNKLVKKTMIIPQAYVERVLKSDSEIQTDIKQAEISRLSDVANSKPKDKTTIGQDSEVTIK